MSGVALHRLDVAVSQLELICHAGMAKAVKSDFLKLCFVYQNAKSLPQALRLKRFPVLQMKDRGIGFALNLAFVIQ